MKIQNLLFDLDGTLVDSSQTIGASIEFAMDSMGIDVAGRTPVDGSEGIVSLLLNPSMAK